MTTRHLGTSEVAKENN